MAAGRAESAMQKLCLSRKKPPPLLVTLITIGVASRVGSAVQTARAGATGRARIRPRPRAACSPARSPRGAAGHRPRVRGPVLFGRLGPSGA